MTEFIIMLTIQVVVSFCLLYEFYMCDKENDEIIDTMIKEYGTRVRKLENKVVELETELELLQKGKK